MMSAARNRMSRFRATRKRLVAEVRDSHWVTAYGNYLNEVEYASRKIGMECVRIDG